jgi:hypothetical protein
MEGRSPSRRPASVAIAAALVALFLALPGVAHAAYPGGNGKIAFSVDRSGEGQIWAVDPNGGGQTQLTDPLNDFNYSRYDSYPVWSPTGDRIAFTRHVCDQACEGGVCGVLDHERGRQRLDHDPEQ